MRKAIAVLAAIVALSACSTESPQPMSAPPEGISMAKPLSAPAIDSISILRSMQNAVTGAPVNNDCKGQTPTGCPELRYGDNIEGYSGGVLVGNVSGVKCTSSNPAVATVNNKCYATVVGAGSTTITITYDRGRLSTSTTLTAL